MKPPLSFYGGKQTIAKKIIEILPPHHHYIEPFCGGAAVFFAKPLYGGPSNYTETLNDINHNIISMYRCFQNKDQREELFERLRYTPHSRDEWNLARDIYRTQGDLPLQERAWATLVLFNQSFGTIGRSWGWAKGKDARLSLRWRNRVDLISLNIEERMRWVQVENRDAFELMEKMDCKGVCFYVDPPYVGADQGEYKGFGQPDLVRLVNFLENCQGSFVVSGYENEAIPKGWQSMAIKTITRTIVARKAYDAKRTEMVWWVDRGM